MRYVIGALLAASMLAPVAAQAQRDEASTERRGDRRGNARVDVGADVDARAPGPRGGDRNERDDRNRGDRADFRPGPANAPALVRGQDDRRPDVGGPDRRNFDGRRDDRNRQWNGQQRPDQSRYDDRRTNSHDDWTRSQIDGRSRFDNGRFDGNRADRRGYGYDTGYGRGYDDRRNDWDRSWRGQSRYDWTRYRTSNRNAFHLPRYYAPSGWNNGYRRFGIGVSLSRSLWGRNYWIGDPYAYRLPEVYGPYRWVRYYDDALLVDLESGQVVDAVYGIFW